MGFPQKQISISIGIVLMTVNLSGCNGTRVSDSVNLTSLHAQKKGVALMRASYAGRNCGSESYTLAQKSGKGEYSYKQVSYVNTPRPLFYIAGPSVAQVELNAGKYYIVNYYCYSEEKGAGHVRKTTIKLQPDRKKISDVFYYKKALASFTVRPGEIVNIGYLSLGSSDLLIGSYSSGKASIGISDLPKQHYEWLKSNRPNLYNKMVKRTMVRVRG